MRLSDFGEPLRTWQEAERYLGDGTRTYSRYAADLEISARYHPQHGARSFAVPTFWVQPDTPGRYLTGALTSPLPTRYRRGEAFLLPVHPEIVTVPAVREQLSGLPEGPPLQVVPSANARTVFVEAIDDEPVPAHFLKLHYPKRLSRFTRRLRQPVIELQLWVAAELARIGAPVLPEVGGGVIGEEPAQAWGFLLRELRPRGPARLPYQLPLFALYGRDLRAPADPTLLEQLIAGSGQDAAAWIGHRLIEPMVTLWAQALLRTGCAIELHGQNTLICLSKDLQSSQIAYRDCAVYVDPAIRHDLGLTGGLPPRNVISRDVRKPRSQVFSLVYDAFLGHHTLAYVARLARERFGVAEAVLHKHARAAFAAELGEAQLLPPAVYYYDDQLRDDGAWELVDTGATPRWR